MNIKRYLARIQFENQIAPDTHTLFTIHEHHIFHVPFENLDVHYKRPFNLELDNIYDKIVGNLRGGFCYEVNLLFYTLLKEIGFDVKIISAKVIDEAGNPGPEYDHMCLNVKLEKDYLADVGFGDLFVRPVEIRSGIQHDGRNYFKIDRQVNGNYLLSMSADGLDFQSKYIFDLTEVPITSFNEPCFDKQTNPDSYFVKNTICTKPTDKGRVTLFNNKLIERRNNERIETVITDDKHMREILHDKFGIAGLN